MLETSPHTCLLTRFTIVDVGIGGPRIHPRNGIFSPPCPQLFVVEGKTFTISLVPMVCACVGSILGIGVTVLKSSCYVRNVPSVASRTSRDHMLVFRFASSVDMS
jgi:hypothetical protein